MNLNKLIGYWLISACFLILLMVAIGGVTRLTHSGLSIVEWKPISGILPPLNHDQWIAEFENYKQYPEYQKINHEMGLHEFKWIYFWEYIHRLIGRFLGFYFVFPFIFFYIKKSLPPGSTKNLLILFLLGGLQGFVGWFMVKSGLVDNPFVSHYRLATHLLLAIVLIAYIFWTYLVYFISPYSKVITLRSWTKIVLKLLPFLILIQIVWGAFTAGLKAGIGWNTFPLMNGQLIPEGLFTLHPWWTNIFSTNMTVQFIHRWLGVLVTLLVMILWSALRKKELTPFQKRSINLAALIVIIQFLLGLFTLLSVINIKLAVLHQVGAVVLFLVSLLLIYGFKDSMD